MTRITVLLCGIMLCAAVGTANAQTSVWDGTHTEWTSGSGTQADPYLIENASHLAHLAYVVNNGIGAGSGRIVGTGSYWKLTANIDLNGSETFQWTPIGYFTSYSDYYTFGGTFDGNGHTIANLFINSTTRDRVGLFGYTDGASIKNVGTTGNTVVIGNQYAGGLVGYANSTVFDNCYNTGSVSSSRYSGGIVGYINENTTVNNCYNTGSVSSDYYSGGIVGHIDDNTTVNNCYNTGSVSGSSYSGGIVGYINENVTVNNCYNTGTLSGEYKYGIASNNSVNNSYYLVTCGATMGGVSKTEVFMKDAEFVRLLNNGEGFAYRQDVSPYTNSGYPVHTQGFEMQLRPAASITQTKATLKCLLVSGDVSITAKQLVCNGQTVNLSSTDTLLVHTVSGLAPDTEYPYTFRAIGFANDTCKLTATFRTLPVTATTLEATDITQTKATLNGEVVFGDATVTKGFEYRLSTETGFTTVEVSSSEANITSRLENLLPVQTYWFRTFCTVGEVMVYGEIQNFSTFPFNMLPVIHNFSTSNQAWKNIPYFLSKGIMVSSVVPAELVCSEVIAVP